jgi:hypothetical protein
MTIVSMHRSRSNSHGAATTEPSRTRARMCASLRRATLAQPQRPSRGQLPLKRIARQPGRSRYATLDSTSLPPADHLDGLHSTQLPITHPYTSVVVESVTNGAVRGPMLGDEVAC